MIIIIIIIIIIAVIIIVIIIIIIMPVIMCSSIKCHKHIHSGMLKINLKIQKTSVDRKIKEKCKK